MGSPRDHHFAARNAGPRLRAEMRRECQLLDGGNDLEPGANRMLGVVLVGLGIPEARAHDVAEVFVRETPVPADFPLAATRERVGDLAELLRIESRCQRRGVRQTTGQQGQEHKQDRRQQQSLSDIKMHRLTPRIGLYHIENQGQLGNYSIWQKSCRRSSKLDVSGMICQLIEGSAGSSGTG